MARNDESRMVDIKINDEKDIAQYVENVLGTKLLDFQKIFLRKVYEAYTKDRNVFILMPRLCGRTSVLRLMELFREYKEPEEEKND